MKKLLSVILVSAVLAGCSPKAPLSIDGKGFRHQKLSELPDSLIKSRTFVKFDSTDPEFMFNSAEDVKIKNGLIYVKYRYNRDSKVLVFDMDGMPAFKVDRKGEGPEEYTQVSAFDIDGKGRIHIIDGRTDELLVYGPGGGFIKRTKLPFRGGRREMPDRRRIPFRPLHMEHKAMQRQQSRSHRQSAQRKGVIPEIRPIPRRPGHSRLQWLYPGRRRHYGIQRTHKQHCTDV